ncbi:expressed protein [Batrachochytrium dendrobatidis JAM81]|uniref:Expressed protein n=2 Tax=Batrachochytrium dendrobatidis TaxID=109871 RepID=F4P0R4_BATDJ|nr:uncharacterized protein BATDEDRAFT_87581 [Batrachochytrium dendrobatidis JAM81]EGF81639.1 expressed protein [Batrachochytrium dendrobatidis JAM81]OAJ38034.1 hypothetical protein BDEG_22003 [Batrachochytrium dendrobatidis JEL423]|eukprot:XP_006678275.1 expressed protein [Batrachochytrium dendrobatidis JAM81]
MSFTADTSFPQCKTLVSIPSDSILSEPSSTLEPAQQSSSTDLSCRITNGNPSTPPSAVNAVIAALAIAIISYRLTRQKHHIHSLASIMKQLFPINSITLLARRRRSLIVVGIVICISAVWIRSRLRSSSIHHFHQPPESHAKTFNWKSWCFSLLQKRIIDYIPRSKRFLSTNTNTESTQPCATISTVNTSETTRHHSTFNRISRLSSKKLLTISTRNLLFWNPSPDACAPNFAFKESMLPVMIELLKTRKYEITLITLVKSDAEEEQVRQLLLDERHELVKSGLDSRRVLFCSSLQGVVHMVKHIGPDVHVDSRSLCLRDLSAWVPRLVHVRPACHGQEVGGHLSADGIDTNSSNSMSDSQTVSRYDSSGAQVQLACPSIVYQSQYGTALDKSQQSAVDTSTLKRSSSYTMRYSHANPTSSNTHPDQFLSISLADRHNDGVKEQRAFSPPLLDGSKLMKSHNRFISTGTVDTASIVSEEESEDLGAFKNVSVIESFAAFK